MSAPLQQAVRFLPKLYFFIPPADRREVKRNQHRLVLTESNQAVLWLLDLIGEEQQAAAVRHAVLNKVMQRLYPRDKCSKIVVGLIEAGCIVPGFDAAHKKTLTLTRFGKAVLEDVKAYHERFVRSLLEELPAEQRKESLVTLERIAAAAWKVMGTGKPRRVRPEKGEES